MKAFIGKLQSKYAYSIIILKQLVATDFKLRYKGSALGYLWTVLRPLALFAVMYLVFVHFLRFGDTVQHYAVYLLLGIVLWSFFVEVTMNGMSAIVGKGDLMRKLSFPRYTVVVSGAVSAFINLCINLLVVGVFIIINGVQLTWYALLVIPVIFELFVLSLAVAFLLGAIYVRLRDVNYVWELILQAGFYATPIIYPISLVQEKSELAAKLLLLNPVAQIIQDMRWVVISKDITTVWGAFQGWHFRLIPVASIMIIAVTAVLYFKRRAPFFAEEI